MFAVPILATIKSPSKVIFHQDPLRRSPRLNRIPSIVKSIKYFPYDEAFDLLLIEGRKGIPKEHDNYNYIITDNWFQYPDLMRYYGPSTIVHVMKFIDLIDSNRKSSKTKKNCVVIRTNSLWALNALFLCSSYLILKKSMKPIQAAKKIDPVLKRLKVQTFKTSELWMNDPNDLPITILDCLNGIRDMLEGGLLQLNKLDVNEIILRESPLNGDMNWLIPKRILGFAGPTDEIFGIKDFTSYAIKNNIKAVIRLNRKHYDEGCLRKVGIKHYDMFIHDGDNPDMKAIEKFYNIADSIWDNGGAMAVHCKAGLGRTGTMVAIFLIRKFKFEAKHVIAFLRIMRPGMVLNAQAKFLQSYYTLFRTDNY